MAVGSFIVGDHIIGDGYVFPEDLAGVTCYLFESAGHFLGMNKAEWEGNTYLAKVIEGSFSGIEMSVDLETRMIDSSEVSLEIENIDGGIDLDEFKGSELKISLIYDGELSRQWIFKILANKVFEYEGKIQIVSDSLLQYYFNGYYPNTELVSAVFPSDGGSDNENACIPKTYGKIPFFPVARGVHDGKAYYILGEVDAIGSGETLTFSFDYDIVGGKCFLEDPWSRDYYDSDDYTFTVSEVEADSNGKYYAIVRCDLLGDGDCAVFKEGSDFLSPGLQFVNKDTLNIEHGEFLQEVLLDFGLTSALINSNSFNQLDIDLANITGLSVPQLRAAFWQKEPRETLWSDLMSGYDCFTVFDNKLSIFMFDSESTETFSLSQINEGSFSPSAVETDGINGVTVRFCKTDIVNGTFDNIADPSGIVTVPLFTAYLGYFTRSTVVNVADDVFIHRSIVSDPSDVGARELEGVTIHGYKLPVIFGQLFAQKKYDISHRVSWESPFDDVSTLKTIVPGKVVTAESDVQDQGGSVIKETQEVLITKLKFTDQMALEISGNVYIHDLEDAMEVIPTWATAGVASGDDTYQAYTVTSKTDEAGTLEYEPGDHEVSPTGFTLSSSYNTLAYTKFGRFVSVQGKLKVSAGGSGEARISLPYAIAVQTKTGGESSGSCSLYKVNLPANVVGINVVVNGGNSYAVIRLTYDDGSWTNLDGSAFSADDEIIIGLTYFA